MSKKSQRPRKTACAAGELKIILQWYRFNTAARERYLKTLLQLPKEERLRDRGASFSSLQEIFVHILDAYQWWFHCIARNDSKNHRDLPAREMSPAEIRAAVRNVNKLVSGFINSLSEKDLGRCLAANYCDDNGKTRQIKILVRDMVWHMVEEELQHRGELNALMWQTGAEPPICSWNR